MLVSELDDVHYDLEVDGEQVRRQLARRIWEQRGWATVAVAFQERARDGTWKAPRLALLRFQRVREAWKRHAQITLAGADALALAETIGDWAAQLAPPADAGSDEDDE